MEKKHKGLLVTVDGPIVEVEVGGYKDIQRLIGCDCFDVMPWLFDDHPTCYVDDEGKLNGSKPNRAIYDGDRLVDIAFGNMLFLGLDVSTGESKDITDIESERVRSRFGGGAEGAGSGARAYNEIMFGRLAVNAKEGLRGRGKL